jgi:glycosyltransferase involved in cell wall biosynthesis
VTLLEAMRAGRAAVATGVGGNAEAVADGITGRIVRVGDEEGMADALSELLGSPARLRAFGDAGQARWRERFTAAEMVARTEAIYREALGRRGRAAAGGAHAAA